MKKPFTRSALITFLATFLYAATSFGQTSITTGVLDPTTVCQGGTVEVPFTAAGTIPALTTYQAQLSDATGAFGAAPTVIGSSATSPISATIPPATAAGTAYKIRVVSILAAVIKFEGTESAALKINAIPAAPTVTAEVIVQQGEAATLTATGTSLLWYDAETGGNAGATKPVPDTSTPGKKSYFVSQTVGTCESDRAEIVVTVIACMAPAKPTVSNKTYEVGDNAPVLTAVGTNLKWYENATGGSALASAPKPATTTAGTTKYYVSQTNASGCESERAEIVVTVSACTPPAKPTVSNKTYEVGDNAPVLTAVGTNLKWYENATGGPALASAPKPATTTAGTTKYYVSQTNASGCESERAEIVVTVSACTPPAKPTVSNKTYEVGDNAPVLTAVGTNLKWYENATGGPALASAPKPSTTTAGTKKYYVSQTNASGCESERAEITVTITDCTPPAKPTVSNKTYEVGDNASVLTAVGTNLKWYENATGGPALASAPKPSTTTVGTKKYYVSQTNASGCESERAEITVTVTDCTPPAKPTVSNKTYEVGDNAPVLTAVGTNLKWYENATGGPALGAAPKPSTTTPGTTKYYVSQTNATGCESPRAEITVTVTCKKFAGPKVSSPLSICQAPADAAPLKATPLAKHTLLWYTSETGGKGSPTAPTPPNTDAKSYSYFVSQLSETTGCESERVEIVVNVREAAKPTVTTPVEYCIGETATALTPSGSTFKWYSSPTDVTGTTTAPKPSTTTAATTAYYVTQSTTYGSLVCESSRVKLDVVVNPRPAALPILSEAFCQEREDKTFTFPTKATEGNKLKWYAAASGGTALTSTPSVNLKASGETTYYVTQLSAKDCESTTRVAQKVRVKPLPGLPTIEKPLIEYCQFVNADPLKATPMAKAALNWFGTNASGGASSDTPPTPSTAEGGQISYYVGQTLDGCLGDRAKIDVKINTTPKPATKTYLEYCQGETAPVLDATGTVLKWYRTVDGEWQGVPFTPFTDKVQDYSFYVTQTGLENKCESPKEEIKIHIKSLPSATISGGSTIDLGSEATLNIKFTGDGPWTYALSNGETNTTDQVNHQVKVKPSTTTSYLVTEVSNACGKGVPIGNAMVIVKVPTINSGNPSVAEACAGKTFIVPFQQSGDFPAENSFKLQIASENQDSKFYTIPSVATQNSVTATFPDTTKGGSYYLRVISSGENPDFLVKGSVSSITISASPLPVATLSGAQTILVGEKATLKVETTGKAPWTFRLDNGTKDTLITAAVSPYTFQIAPPATVTYTITAVTNSCGAGKGTGSARVQVDPILGVEPQQPADWVKVYPTLVQSVCTVEVTGTIKPKQASIEVIDLNGRSRGVKSIEQKNTDVDFSTYPSGLYLLRIQNGNLSTVQRVMKP
ncbi:Ig-like domain-containing protein [Dyadobacter aurulentus]|uniref:Ig-like domain-containing protein n=1 Tax=Dyadobacter sp. UC 10 TaxID=2605428 RepID=UPI0011F3D25A|nr:T9SS type A sorting domain-containing protein [Dyadobacter sp. UC 10]KAA0990897.1 T9SS type A sorting domain-containing protein [Dyadobacter sp. UC 10]